MNPKEITSWAEALEHGGVVVLLLAALVSIALFSAFMWRWASPYLSRLLEALVNHINQLTEHSKRTTDCLEVLTETNSKIYPAVQKQGTALGHLADGIAAGATGETKAAVCAHVQAAKQSLEHD